MISAATITALEERKLEYILGARERSSAVVRRLVLEDETPLTPLLVERVRGETQLFVKEVKVGAARYVLCRNHAEAERERNERQAIVGGRDRAADRPIQGRGRGVGTGRSAPFAASGRERAEHMAADGGI